MDGFFEETVFWEQGRVKITNRRVIAADGKSYPLPEIESADEEVDVRWDGRLTLGIIAGCFVAFMGVSVIAGSPSDLVPGVGLLIAGVGVAVVSFLVQSSIEETSARHVVRVKTQSQETGIIYESRDPVKAQLILRAIRVAMLVGNDPQSFRVVFYHPPIPGEVKPVHPDLSENVNDPFG